MDHVLVSELTPNSCSETGSFLLLQLEFMHGQLMTILSERSLEELAERPNLDLSEQVEGREKELSLAFETSHRSAGAMLGSF